MVFSTTLGALSATVFYGRRAGASASARQAAALHAAAAASGAHAPVQKGSGVMRGMPGMRPPTDDVRYNTDDRGGDSSEVIEFPTLVAEYIALPAPSGHVKVFASWNRGLNGPTRRVPLNATIRVTVENSLWSDTTTVHHHGIHQVGTPYFDGTMNIAQPGIAPGRKMTYEFIAWPAGSHWYHSHSSMQLGDGLKGMFIVEDPDDPWLPHYGVDEALFFYEWNYESALEMFELKENAPYTPQPFEGGLVNGIFSHNATIATDGYITSVGAGRNARLRFCYGGINYKFVVSIEGHNMTVIAKDGTSVQPIEVSSIQARRRVPRVLFSRACLSGWRRRDHSRAAGITEHVWFAYTQIHAGERFDVLVHGSQTPGDYMIDFEVRRGSVAAARGGASPPETSGGRDRRQLRDTSPLAPTDDRRVIARQHRLPRSSSSSSPARATLRHAVCCRVSRGCRRWRGAVARRRPRLD